MKTGRCRYFYPIVVKTERGLRDAAAKAAKARGTSVSEIVRAHLRQVVAAEAAAAREARP